MKAILKRHGAFIAVDANEPQGSVFTITFPKDGSADGEKFVDAEETSAEAAEETSTEVSEDPSVDVAEAFVDVEDPSTEAEEKTPAEAAETDEQSVVQN